MKNLKKVLALVLVVATLMGMATMASATTSDDYSDAEAISHVEAVDVMSTIGVFDGISGAFSGDSILTREQAAKIITYMILGKEDADALVASVAPYTDVSRDRWSAGSIAYCKNEGILAGVGNGKFEPDGKLTGVAFAKMCLVALGYDPEIETLTGPQWAVNTSKLAIAGAGITTDLSQPSLADEMSREDACQMAFNTIQADMVDYESRGTNINVNDANVSVSASLAKPVSVATGWKDTDRRDGNMYADAYEKGQDGIEQFAENYFIDLEKTGTETDDLGRPSVTWTYKSDEIGTYVRNNWLVQSWTAKAPKIEMYNAIGSTTYDHLYLYNGNTTNSSSSSGHDFVIGQTSKPGEYYIDVDSNLFPWLKNNTPTLNTSKYAPLFVTVDGESVGNNNGNGPTIANYFDKKSSAAAGYELLRTTGNKPAGNIGLTGNGVLTELYKNNKGEVWIAMINTYLVQATADYNSAMNRVNVEAMPIDEENKVSRGFLPTFIDGDDFDVSGVKDGDYLLLTVSVSQQNSHTNGNSKTEIKSVTPATVQTAPVTEYTEKDYVTMGGTKYSYNRILGDDEKFETFAINSEASLVLDTYGYIMYVAEAINSSNFVYIDNYAEESHLRRNFIADAYFADGTNAEIQVGKIDDYKIGADSDHEIIRYRTRELLVDNSVGANNNIEYLGKRIGNQEFSHWFTFSKSSSGEYTLRTPSAKRYDEPLSAMTTSSAAGNILIKHDTVRFLSKVASGSCMDMYDVQYDTDRKVLTTPTTVMAQNDTNKKLQDVRGNSKTIFVIRNAKGDVDTYTGIENVPTVTLGSDHQGGAKVSWINRHDSNYASFVFVDVYSTGSATITDEASVADYMFTLKDTGDRTYVDGLDYLRYTVVIDGKVEERWISSALVGLNHDAGVLFKKIKVDSNGRITDGSEIGGQGKTDKEGNAETSFKCIPGTTSTIAQKNGALEIATDSQLLPNISQVVGSIYLNDLYDTSKSNINVVIAPSSQTVSNTCVYDFMNDPGADYEEHRDVSAGYVAGMFQNYQLDAKVYAVVTEDNEDEIDTLWIYVEDATK